MIIHHILIIVQYLWRRQIHLRLQGARIGFSLEKLCWAKVATSLLWHSNYCPTNSCRNQESSESVLLNVEETIAIMSTSQIDVKCAGESGLRLLLFSTTPPLAPFPPLATPRGPSPPICQLKQSSWLNSYFTVQWQHSPTKVLKCLPNFQDYLQMLQKRRLQQPGSISPLAMFYFMGQLQYSPVLTSDTFWKWHVNRIHIISHIWQCVQFWNGT